MKEYVVRTTNLTKQFKEQKAVDEVSVHVERGAIYGFIGRNGAGKTTFLKMIAGLSEPTSGTITLFGQEGKERRQVTDRIGVLIEAPGLYPDMNAFDNLRLKAMCMGIYKENYVEDILALVGLEDTKQKKVKNFSLGMKQRLGIGMALIGEPDLLVLDEPINGLDPQGIIEVRETILRLNGEKHLTIIISSHILEELSKMVTHYGIIHQGQLVNEMTREQLMEQCEERIQIIVNDTRKACIVLEQQGITKYKVIDYHTIYVYERLQEIGTINTMLVKQEVEVLGIGLHNESLESYFISVTEEV